ncbi:hypothetical protein QJS66_11880 [Kocuria rhizophila]|nr:hypothetical protein QJS66_11880 [Kocuria rhizophila]
MLMHGLGTSRDDLDVRAPTPADWTATFTEENSIKAGEYLRSTWRRGTSRSSRTAPTTSDRQRRGAAGVDGSLGGLKEAAKFDSTPLTLRPQARLRHRLAQAATATDQRTSAKATAAKFIDFTTNTDTPSRHRQATGYMPVRKDAMEKPEEKKFLEENPKSP